MTFRASALILAVLWLAPGCSSHQPDSLPTIRTASFTFPALASVMAEVVAAKQIDRQHGFRLEARPFGSVATYYAALSRGEVDTAPGGPLVFQRMREQGIPVVITSTYATLASLVVIARSPEVVSLSGLKGRTLAADMASSEYSILQLLARRMGLSLSQEIKVLQATPAVARAHLMTGEADAILSFEPTATVVLLDQPDHHVVFEGLAEWQKLGIGDGWLLLSLFHEPFAREHPRLVAAFVAALQEAAEFIRENPPEADAIVSQGLNLDAGVLLRALNENRIQFVIEDAVKHRDALLATFRIGLELEYAGQMPAPESIFSPSATATRLTPHHGP